MCFAERFAQAGHDAIAIDYFGRTAGSGPRDEHFEYMPEDVEAFDRSLVAAGVEHEIVSYPGAPHSFFDRSFAEHAEASEDAWRRVLDFLQRL